MSCPWLRRPLAQRSSDRADCARRGRGLVRATGWQAEASWGGVWYSRDFPCWMAQNECPDWTEMPGRSGEPRGECGLVVLSCTLGRSWTEGSACTGTPNRSLLPRRAFCAWPPGRPARGLACTLRMEWHWIEFLRMSFQFLGRVPSLCSVLECVFAPVLAGAVAVCLKFSQTINTGRIGVEFGIDGKGWSANETNLRKLDSYVYVYSLVMIYTYPNPRVRDSPTIR